MRSARRFQPAHGRRAAVVTARGDAIELTLSSLWPGTGCRRLTLVPVRRRSTALPASGRSVKTSTSCAISCKVTLCHPAATSLMQRGGPIWELPGSWACLHMSGRIPTAIPTLFRWRQAIGQKRQYVSRWPDPPTSGGGRFAICHLPDGISRSRHDPRFPRRRCHDLEGNQLVQPRLDRTPAFTCRTK